MQARSAVTVEAIYEATFQVLLAMGGADRLTTTRVAERAGVSVGTLYQYFPNKQSLLLSALEKHQNQVVGAVELACRRNHGRRLSTMIESVVKAFVDAKLERSDISMALYATAVGAQEERSRTRWRNGREMPSLRCWQPPRTPSSSTCRSRVSCSFQRWAARREPFSKPGPRRGWCVCCESS